MAVAVRRQVAAAVAAVAVLKLVGGAALAAAGLLLPLSTASAAVAAVAAAAADCWWVARRSGQRVRLASDHQQQRRRTAAAAQAQARSSKHRPSVESLRRVAEVATALAARVCERGRTWCSRSAVVVRLRHGGLRGRAPDLRRLRLLLSRRPSRRVGCGHDAAAGCRGCR